MIISIRSAIVKSSVVVLASTVFHVAAASHAARPAGFIEQLEITETIDAFDGKTPAGAPGPYQVIAGIVHGKLDPRHPANKKIVDLDRAPIDKNGYVAYSTDFVILRPKEARTAKRVLFYDVANRGRKLGMDFFIGAKSLRKAPAPADTYPSLLRAGYTIVWSGWQGDLPLSAKGVDGLLGVRFPQATNQDGSPITGLSREEYIADYHLGNNSFALSYPPASLRDKTEVVFTARQSWRNREGKPDYQAPSSTVTDWRYEPKADGSINVVFTPPASVPGSDGAAVTPDQGTIYSFVYRASNPKVMGVGFAAVRDLVLFLRDQSADAQGTPNPLNDMKQAACATPAEPGRCAQSSNRNFDLTIGEGISQSGRFMREFLYAGFNQAPRTGKVFDGMLSIISGGRRTWVNARFAQPGRWSKGHEEHWMPGDQFPFAYNVIKDPLGQTEDGLLKECTASGTCPRIMQIDGSFEWWGGRASLVVTDGRGDDLVLPDNVRYYLIAGTQHGGGDGVRSGLVKMPAAGNLCQFAPSPVLQTPVERALIPAMENWLARNMSPPPSRYPTVAANTAVAPDPASLGLPALRNVTVPADAAGGRAAVDLAYFPRHNALFVTDYSAAAPVADLSRQYQVLVPRVDATGNEMGAIAVPDVAVPLATYTGWNVRGSGHAQGESCSSLGATIPLAISVSSRTASDPRPSLDTLYSGRADYIAKVKAAGAALVEQGYLTPQDAEHLFNAHARQVSPALIPAP